MTLSILASLVVIFTAFTTVASVAWLISRINTTVESLIELNHEFKDTLLTITAEMKTIHTDVQRLKLRQEFIDEQAS